MNSLQDVWRTRFTHYMGEVQKYMRFVFTGHLAIVIMFVLGAGGYQYSEWLKTASSDFPAIWLTAAIIGIILGFSRPVTLIRKPDEVYLLPLETKLPQYFNKALKYTFGSQIIIIILFYMVTWPMLRQVTGLEPNIIIMGLVAAILLKWWNIHSEFSYRWAYKGHRVWMDRIVRMVCSFVLIASILSVHFIPIIIMFLIIVSYPMFWKRKLHETPFPYEHFVQIEENRMMGIYRFANYFTDVPNIHGSIRRRVWLDWAYKLIPYAKQNTQEYLVFRSFVRTDDHFYLWLRLTLMSALAAAFIHIPIAIAIVTAALAFATAIQLKQALTTSTDFRMDMLYPLPQDSRKRATMKIVRYMIIVQAIIVLLSGIGTPYFYVQGLIVLIVGELTLRLSK
ncbi:ABC transporter permease [Rummeliibacillus pycnus]|uniref:ABC transporter permease n=1 Tax=Rummeliibacillus pycnus TaxID=101070 RepID=UPI003D2C46AA